LDVTGDRLLDHPRRGDAVVQCASLTISHKHDVADSGSAKR
jgi:hypothetical protein